MTEKEWKIELGSVSVIIPVYNRVKSIGRALDSVLKQTYQPKEIIVVDDGSTDGTVDYIRENYPQVTVLTQANQGPSAARNRGIAHSTGEWVALLDSDDIWLPDKLRAQVQIIEKNPGLGMIGSRRYKNCYDYDEQVVKRPVARAVSFFHFLKQTTCHTSTVLLRREALEKVGLFDEKLPAAEDVDLWVRIAYYYKVVQVRQHLTAVFVSKDSISLNRKKTYYYDLHVLAKWDPGRPDTLDVEKRISPIKYRRIVFNNTLQRAWRLYKHYGQAEANEFLAHAREILGLSLIGMEAISGYLRLRGLRLNHKTPIK